MRLPLLLATLSAALLPAIPSLADPVTYTYTGNPFDSASAPYTTSDFLKITLTYAAPLQDNLDGQSSASTPTPLAFTVSDGVHTFNNTDGVGGSTFGTDAQGNIIGWGAAFVPDNIPGVLILSDGIEPIGLSEDLSEISTSDINAFGEIEGDPGAWTVSGLGSSPTPEPGTLLLLATGIVAGAGTLLRRRGSIV